MIENNENVKTVEMFPQVKCFCPLGKDWYTNKLHITLEITDYYIDYLDVQKFLKEEVEGHGFTIEGACKKIYDFLKEQGFEEIEIEAEASDGAHFPVKVTCY